MIQSTDGLKRLLAEAGIDPLSTGAIQMLRYLELLKKWNASINLTATTEWTGIEPLFREAMSASKFYPIKAFSHLDIGSGGGFPAIPLRILRPQFQLDMVESRVKRCVFLETAADVLGINGIVVHNLRLDAFLKNVERDKKWDCISWKAIKLAADDLDSLRNHAHEETQFWMFHGSELAVVEPEEFRKRFLLVRGEKLHVDRDWHLSIYCSK